MQLKWVLKSTVSKIDLPIQDDVFVEEIYPDLKNLGAKTLFDLLKIPKEKLSLGNDFVSIIDNYLQKFNDEISQNLENSSISFKLKTGMTAHELDLILDIFGKISIEPEGLILSESKRTTYKKSHTLGKRKYTIDFTVEEENEFYRNNPLFAYKHGRVDPEKDRDV